MLIRLRTHTLPTPPLARSLPSPRGVLVWLCLLALLFVAPCVAVTQEEFNEACLDASSMPGMAMPGMGIDCDASVPAGYENANATDFEVMFLRRMIIHHTSAIEMAELIPSRAEHAELLSLGQNISSSQTQEIEQMTQWLQQWYAFTPPPVNQTGMGAMMMPHMGHLSSLRGAAFDLAFLDMMLPHHMGAINDSLAAESRVAHPEVRTLAQDIVMAQQREVGLMQTWQAQWSTNSGSTRTRVSSLLVILLSSAAWMVLSRL